MIELTDQNFNEALKSAGKPVLVDFFAEWCSPCRVLAPILEKVSEEFKEELIFAKVNVDTVPLTARELGVNMIPTVLLFSGEKVIGGFAGVQPEEAIRQLLKKSLKLEPEDIESTIKEYEEYASQKGFKLNPKKEIVETIVKGLLNNKEKYGERYCPCRRVTGDSEQDKNIICPCAYHKEELEKQGSCLCQLFVR